MRMLISKGIRLLPILVVLVGLLMGPATVLAQSEITVSEMSVALWPEYDKPGVLVIYSGSLSPDVRLPVDITFSIPASAGKPSATAGVDDTGTYRYRQYQTVQEGDSLLVSYNLPYRRFQLEYYYDPLSGHGQGNDKQFVYTYAADYAVDSFSLEVQEPGESEGFVIDPPADSQTVEMQLPLNLIQVGPLAAGDEASVTVSYHKASTALSAEALGVPTPGSVEFEDAPRQGSGSQSTLIIGIVAAGVIAIVIALVLWSRAQQKKTSLSRQARRKATRKTGGKPAPQRVREPASGVGNRRSSDGNQITGYCHQCGRALKADEHFCPGCGTARKH
jgi:hypothetical protein